MSAHPLRKARESHGWSQRHLAETLGVTPRTISRWEQGQAFPYPYYRERLCALFGKNALELGILPGNERPPGPEPLPPETTPHHVLPDLFDPLIPEALSNKQRLLGREALLTVIKESVLSREGSGRTALRGLPGVGKTALAAALITDPEIQVAFHDGILWAGLGLHPDVLNLLVRWGTLLGITPPPGKQAALAEEWAQVLRIAIGNRRMLLILDDAWELETALALQVGGPNCAYLLTTRSPQIAADFARQGMLNVPELTELDGLALLERTVPELVAHETRLARALVREVGALPLALTLLGNILAAQVFTGQPRRARAALARLQQAEQRLRVSMPIAPGERPPSLSQDASLSLQATIAISEQELDSKARTTLRVLAIFPPKPNSFSEEAALAVSQASGETLDTLWNAGLLESNGPGRYRLHQTIADYKRIQEPLPQADERFVRFTEQYLQSHTQDYQALELEMNNILAALDSAIELEMAEQFISSIDLLAPFFARRGRYQLADQYLQKAYKMAQVLENSTYQVTVLQHLAYFSEKRGEYQQAQDYAQQGLLLVSQFERPDARGNLLTTLATANINQGADLDLAVRQCEQALMLARQLGDGKRICILLHELSRIAGLRGHYTQALEMAQGGLQLARQQGDDEDIALMLRDIGSIHIYQGNYTQAKACFLEALELAQQLDLREMQIALYNALVPVSENAENSEQAEAYLRKGLQLAHQIGHRSFICIGQTNLGAIALIKGKYAEAETYLQEGLILARQINHRSLLLLLSNLGEAVGYQGHYELANSYFEESVQAARQTKNIWSLSAALGSWGDIHLHFQQLDLAESTYQEVLALQASAEVDQKMSTWARYGLARVAAQRGQLARARQLGQACLLAFQAMTYYKATEVEQWLQSLPPHP